MTTPFRAFAEHFCNAFELDYSWEDGRLHARLPEPLALHFGRDTVVWTFTPHDPGGELVAFGSRAFEEMLAYTGGHGRVTAVRLPLAEIPADFAVTALAGELTLVGEEVSETLCHVFNFQLAYACDERVERLFEVCLDAQGHQRPDLLAWLLATGDTAAAMPAQDASTEVERTAEALALAEAEAWVGPLEAAALGRLVATAERLVSYYEAQMRELPVRRRRGQNEEEAVAESEDLRLQLARELERKLRDETARHQMRVQIRRIGQAVVALPTRSRVYRLTAPATGRSRELTIALAGQPGRVTAPACERCGERPGAYGLCALNHVACAACLTHCGGCDRPSCHAELTACAGCGRANCEGCQARCASGHLGCAAHLAPCIGCGQALCPRCERPHGCGFAGP